MVVGTVTLSCHFDRKTHRVRDVPQLLQDQRQFVLGGRAQAGVRGNRLVQPSPDDPAGSTDRSQADAAAATATTPTDGVRSAAATRAARAHRTVVPTVHCPVVGRIVRQRAAPVVAPEVVVDVQHVGEQGLGGPVLVEKNK